MKKLLVVAFLAVPCVHAQAVSGTTASVRSEIPSSDRHISRPSVTVGRPKVYTYQRVFPLLDGRFQDTAAITVNQLNLTPDSASAYLLDAIQIGIAASVAFNPVTGALNSAATQNYTTAMNLQNNLLSQEQSLLTQLQTAQTAQNSAQAAVDALSPTDAKNPANPTVMASTAANNQVTNAKAQLATVTALQAAQTAPTYQSPGTPPTPTALGTLPTLTPPSANTGPSLPPTKQLENQVEILGDRLMKVVGALTQPDDLYGKNLFLIEFNPSVQYSPKNNLVLRTGYTVTCNGAATTVVELYPRASSVNIADSKYRDSKLSLSFLLSLFSTGASASYNREHLKQTQALAESSFVTGYGVGDSTFGWVFGKVFGQDTVSSGVKTTYALVAGDDSCSKDSALVVTQSALEWAKENNHDAPQKPPKGVKKTLANWTYPAATLGGTNPNRTVHITKMAYSPVAYDPTKPTSTNSAVLVTIEFDRDLDYQLSLTADGTLVKRVRDTFGRATTSGGSGGLLEASQLDPMTWIPTGNRSLLLKLDSSQIKLGFPQLLFSSPLSTTSLSDALAPISPAPATPLTVDIKVLGRQLDCGLKSGSCEATLLPAPAYAAGIFKPILVARHISTGANASTNPNGDTLYVTVDLSQTTTTASSTAGTQFVAGDSVPTWSGAARAAIVLQSGKMFPLNCNTDDPKRLACTFPKRDDSAVVAQSEGYSFAVSDSQYTNVGPLIGFKDAKCINSSGLDLCRSPLLWSYDPPVPKMDHGAPYWKISPKLLGLRCDSKVTLQLTNQSQLEGVLNCPIAAVECPDKCTVDFTIHPVDLPNLEDIMTVLVNGEQHNPLRIGRVAFGVSPIVSKMDVTANAVTLSGLNLFFDQLQIGANGKPFPAVKNCALLANGRSICTFTKGEFGKSAGLVFFSYKGQSAAAVSSITADTTLTGLMYTPPAKRSADTKQVPAPADATLAKKEKDVTHTFLIQ
jgi:hypothetical protein